MCERVFNTLRKNTCHVDSTQIDLMGLEHMCDESDDVHMAVGCYKKEPKNNLKRYK